ncbi:cell wall protein DAN4 [Echeneis naucrates]|uniref:Cell wall protein DAN4-like n=1 Tax=Echeneis naucrates TaxID=173247 RepID=A0A665TQV9_ECHNA|nr:cell wall protein DAN4-like [Echeneis naucrates]
MTSIFISLSFIWLLPFTASSTVTMGHHPNFTNLMTAKVTGSDFTLGYPTVQEASTTKPSSEASDKSSSPSATNFKPSQSHNSAAGVEPTTDGHLQITTSAMKLATHQGSNPTTTTPSSSTQSPEEEKTWTSQWKSDKTTFLSTQVNPTTATSGTSTGSSPVTVEAGTHSYKPSTVTSKKPIIHITRPKKDLSKKGRNHSEAVAGIIGGALALMMLGFLVIFIKKRKLQKQQITTTEWAGPSPFLAGGSEDGHITVRSSNQISLSTFLPQRLSKRFSLISEADKELEDMTEGTTFGDKHQQVDGDNALGSIGAAAPPEMKNTEDIPEMVENSESVDSSKANHCLFTGDLSEAAQLSPEATSLHPLSKAVENPDKVPN